MTTIAVAAILAAVSIPMYTSFVRNQRVKTAAYDLSYALTLARGEALKRNSSVTVSPDTNGWKFGWSVATTGGSPVTLFHERDPDLPGRQQCRGQLPDHHAGHRQRRDLQRQRPTGERGDVLHDRQRRGVDDAGSTALRHRRLERPAAQYGQHFG